MKCYTCGEIGHISWECPRNKLAAQRNANIDEAHEESNEETKVNNPPQEREYLMLNRVLVKTERKCMNQPKERVYPGQNTSCKVSVVKLSLIVVVQIIWFP